MPDFLTEAEEAGLLALLPELSFGEVRMRGVVAKRRVALVWVALCIRVVPAGAGAAPPFGIVAGISLGGQSRMRFRKGSAADRVTVAATLPPRSITSSPAPPAPNGST